MQQLDMAGLNLQTKDEPPVVDEPPPKLSMAREKVLEEARKAMEAAKSGKKAVSIVVIGMSSIVSISLEKSLVY